MATRHGEEEEKGEEQKSAGINGAAGGRVVALEVPGELGRANEPPHALGT